MMTAFCGKASVATALVSTKLPVLKTVRQISSFRPAMIFTGTLQSSASAAFGSGPRSSTKKLLHGFGTTQR